MTSGKKEFTWDCSAGFQHRYELMIDGFFKLNLLLQDGVGTRLGLADAYPVDDESRVSLAGGIGDGRVLIAVVAGRVAQARPVEFVLGNARHEVLNHITAVCNLDSGLAVARNDSSDICCGNNRVDRIGIAKNGLDEGRDGGRVAVVETDGNRKDFVVGCGRDRDVQSSAYRVGTTEVIAETEYLRDEKPEQEPSKMKHISELGEVVCGLEDFKICSSTQGRLNEMAFHDGSKLIYLFLNEPSSCVIA